MFFKSIRNWLQPKFTAPVVNHCLQAVRGMANHRHKKVIKLAKGFRGRANRCFTVAYHRVTKARQYAYRDRKVTRCKILIFFVSFSCLSPPFPLEQVKKREFRALWIQRINAASRMYGLPYSILINNLAKSEIALNRKVLSELAVTEPLSFKSVVEVAKLAKA